MKYSKITGTGGYLPPNVMTNEDWATRVETSSEWIVERTGIQSRHVASQDETAAGMAVKAASKALEMAQISAKDIDLIVCATATPEKLFPSTACLVQKHLGAGQCCAFDVQAACSGFVYALSIADNFIKAGQAKHALIIGTELMSRLIDWSDRNTCVLFGDGAGAAVLSQSDTPGVLATRLYADGGQSDLLTVDNMQMGDHTKTLSHLSETDNLNTPLAELNPYVQMKGKHVFKHAVNRLGELVSEMMDYCQINETQIDWLVPHQANIRIIQATADKLNLPMSKVICTIEHHANTSSASIPLALDVALRDGRIKPGQTVLFEAFGGGLTWGSALVTL